MPEQDLIHVDQFPQTVESMAEQLAMCGFAAGQTVMVHTAMSKIGWIAGGAEAVIAALLKVLTPSGTLMMPTHTTNNTDPEQWRYPPVPPHWWQIIRDQTTPYNPATTPTRQMGSVAELFRTMPGVLRSPHPVTSCAAYGPNAAYLVGEHPLEQCEGENSPVGKLYALNGYVMLIGVDHFNNTSLHLAEERATYPGKRRIRQGSAVLMDSRREWVWYDVMDTDGDDFGAIGEAYEAAVGLPIHKVGQADVRFMKQREVVDFAVQWMEQNRDLTVQMDIPAK